MELIALRRSRKAHGASVASSEPSSYGRLTMAGRLYDSSLTRVRPFFHQLIEADPSGESWLPPLIAATAHGDQVFGNVATDPGPLLGALVEPGSKGYLGCFEYPVGPARSLLHWYVDHADELVWPKVSKFSDDTVRWRRALLYDEPPGRAQAQQAAHAFVDSKPTTVREWWRFEGTSMIDCVLMTPKLVLTIEGKRTEPLSAATDWFPQRSQLVRNLEAAKQLAKGRAWGSMLMSETVVPEGTDEALDDALPASAPHLIDVERNELHAHYLGNLTWEAGCQAAGVSFDSLPDTTTGL